MAPQFRGSAVSKSSVMPLKRWELALRRLSVDELNVVFCSITTERPGCLEYKFAHLVSLPPICYNDWYMKKDQRLYRERIVADPRILAGKPVVKGTRIAVDLVLEELSHNPDIGELLAAHPDLTRTDVQACLAYAKDMVTGEEVSPKPPKGVRSDAAL
jgi:uncharacterized protein (DUF433 family)